uniref:Uncharacterized protein n=1 Tax=Janibacter limosus TaxID=53458 RepID=A0AC61U1W6_9MICO|nr:hypothetical protein [Janibacter limosus]
MAVDAATIGGPQTLAEDGLTLEAPAFYEIGSPADPSGAAAVHARPGTGLLAAVVGRRVDRHVVDPRRHRWPRAAGHRSARRSGRGTVRRGAGRTAGRCLLPVAAHGSLHLLRTPRRPHAGRRVPRPDPAPAGSRRHPRGVGCADCGPEVAGRGAGRRCAHRGTAIVRIDALRETMLLIPVAAVLLARSRGWARHLSGGAVGTTLAGFAVAGVMSWRYLGEIGGSLVPLVGLVVLMSIGCWWLLRRARAGWSLPDRLTARLPVVLAGAVVVVGVLPALRPSFMTTRQDPRDPGAMYVARMQAELGLPIDGGRTYAEHSVDWLAWWIGPIAVTISLVVLAVPAHRLGTRWAKGGPLPAWSAALVVTTGSTLLTLVRPGITPDHPRADRRLLIALPLALVLCVAAAWWAGARARERWGSAAGATVLVVLPAATAVPTAMATWPHRAERVEAGGLAAAGTYCDALEPDDVVLAVDDWAVNHWTRVTRGMCGVPSRGDDGQAAGRPPAGPRRRQTTGRARPRAAAGCCSWPTRSRRPCRTRVPPTSAWSSTRSSWRTPKN